MEVKVYDTKHGAECDEKQVISFNFALYNYWGVSSPMDTGTVL